MWKNISNEKPKVGLPVLVFIRGSYSSEKYIAYMGKLFSGNFIEWFVKSETGYSYCGYQFTHWDYLPDDPK